MIERYTVVASRIRQELTNVEVRVERAERAAMLGHQHPGDEQFFLDSAALNLHTFYAGLERVFRLIATSVDRSTPSGPDWHRELLSQMSLDLPKIRRPVLSQATVKTVDEFLRFRHVLQNIYAFELDPERIEHLTRQLGPCFDSARKDLLAFAEFLDQLAQE